MGKCQKFLVTRWKFSCILAAALIQQTFCRSITSLLDDPSCSCTSPKALVNEQLFKAPCMNSIIERLGQQGNIVDKQTYIDVLKCSGDFVSPVIGMRIHDYIVKHACNEDAHITTLLLQMYVKCGRLDEALRVLMKAYQHGASESNLLMKAYAAQGDAHKAFKLFDHMRLEKIMPSKSTCIRLLSMCCSKADLDKGRELHIFLQSTNYKMDLFVGTALIRMYGKCGSIEEAWQTFKDLPQKDVVSFSVMIRAYALNGRGMDAIELLHVMEEDGLKPDKVAFLCALDACNNPSLLGEGEKLHILIQQSGVEVDVVVATALINMYGKCGNVEAARLVFDKMRERNIVSWNNLLAVYVWHNQSKEAIKLLDQMGCDNVKPDRITCLTLVNGCANDRLLAEGERIHGLVGDQGLENDVALGNALLNMYGRCGDVKKAKAMFDEMAQKDIVAWNTMIALHAQNEEAMSGLELLNQMMEEGFTPDKVTFGSILNACAGCSVLLDGKKLHSRIVKSDLELDAFIRSALIDIYGKCGHLNEAIMVFESRLEQDDVITWNIMCVLYAQHEQWEDVSKLFAQMQVEGVKPDCITFSCLFDVCASTGMLSKGEKLHLLLLHSGHQLDSILGTALVNMYGKCGELKSAMGIFDRLNGSDPVSFTSMIVAFAQHGHADGALGLFHNLLIKGVTPDDAMFVSVLTACSHSGLFDEAFYCLASMISSYCLLPAIEHYVCVIDLFGRAGRLDEAEIIIHMMPTNTSDSVFLSLLGACRCHVDIKRGERAASHVLQMGLDDDGSSYVTLSNIYAAAASSPSQGLPVL